MDEAFTKKNHSDKHLFCFALAAVIALGAFLRFYHLSKPAYNGDELFSVWGAESLIKTGHPILPSGLAYTRAFPFTVMISLVYRVLGVSEFSSRLPCVLFGILAIWATERLGTKLVNRTVGLSAAALLAVSSFAVNMSRFCRMYSLHLLLYPIVLYVIYEALDGAPNISNKNRFLLAFAAGFLFALNVRIHPLAVFLAPGLLVYCAIKAAFIANRSDFKNALLSRHGVTLILLTGFIAMIFIVPALKKNFIFALNWLPDWAKSDATEYKYYKWFLEKLYPGCWIAIVPGIFAGLFKRAWPTLFLATALFVPLAVLSYFPLKTDRYILQLLPVFLILLAGGFYYLSALAIAQLQRLMKMESVRQSSAAAIACVVFTAAVMIFSPATATPRHIDSPAFGTMGGQPFYPWRDVVEYLKPRISPRDTIISYNTANLFYYLGKVEYGFNPMASVEIHDFNVRDKDGKYLDYVTGARWIETTEELKAAASVPNVWLVLQRPLLDARKQRMNAEEIDFVQKNFTEVFSPGDGYIVVFKKKA